MLKVKNEQRILTYSNYVDMRKSFDGLVALTRNILKENVFSGDLYIFHNRRGNIVKILSWDRTGFVLYSKRLEQGKFKINSNSEKNILTEQQLFLMLDGINLGRKK